MKLQDYPSASLADIHRLLSTAIAAATTVQFSRLSWCAIAATLSRLSAALDDPHLAVENPLAADLLFSVARTLPQILTLADLCRSADPIAGKLRTNSDLSFAGDTLERLASDAELILSLSPEFAAAGFRTEAIVARLQLGSLEARLAALDSIIAILDKDKNATGEFASAGAVPTLFRLLDSGASEVREKATAVIARLSAVESCRRFLVTDCGAGRLARVLDSGGGAARENACFAFQNLTLDRDGALTVGLHFAALVEICGAGTPSAQAAAAAVLENLAVFGELRGKFLDEHGLSVLLRVLACGTPLAQENVIGCLRNLLGGEESDDFKLAIFRGGGLEFVKSYFEGCGVGDRNLENAIGLLRNLASFRYIAEIIVNAGFLAWIVAALDSVSSGTRIEAARAVSEFASEFGKDRREFEEALPLLIQMLEAKTGEEKETAVKALASLLSLSMYRKLFKKEERGIANVVQLLDPLVKDVDKKCVISALVLLSHSWKCRKQMVEAGACKFLHRLAAMQVDGVKRLLEILDKGKIWGVFPRT